MSMSGSWMGSNDDTNRTHYYDTSENSDTDDVMTEMIIDDMEELTRVLEYKSLIDKQKKAHPNTDYSWLIDRPTGKLPEVDRQEISRMCSMVKCKEWPGVIQSYRKLAPECESVRDLLPMLRFCVNQAIMARPKEKGSLLGNLFNIGRWWCSQPATVREPSELRRISSAAQSVRTTSTSVSLPELRHMDSGSTIDTCAAGPVNGTDRSENGFNNAIGLLDIV